MWAIHRLLGVVSTINAMSSVSELRYLVKSAGCGAIFTCRSLLATTRRAATTCGIPDSHIFVIDEDKVVHGNHSSDDPRHLTVADLIELGSRAPPLSPVEWGDREGQKRTAFLSWSSGTSGLPVRPPYAMKHGESLELLTQTRRQ